MNNKVYIVSLCTAITKRFREDGTFYGVRDIHTFGIFDDIHDATRIVEERKDIGEGGYYEYAVLEGVVMGLSVHNKTTKEWYKLGERGNVRSDPPNGLGNAKRIYTKGT